MADFLEIRNDNGSVVIGDDFPVLQPVRTNIYDVTSYTDNTFPTTTQVIRPYGQYRGSLALAGTLGYNYDANADLLVYRAYVVGGASNGWESPHFFRSNAAAYIDTVDKQQHIRIQEVYLAGVRYQSPVPGSCLAAYNSNNEFVFDAGLGVANFLCSTLVNTSLNKQDEYILLGDFNGYDLDFNKIYFRFVKTPQKTMTEYRGSNQYREGVYCWTPRVYLDGDGKLWAHLKYYTPNGYGTFDSDPLNPTFSMQAFYLPTVRPL